MEITEQYRNHQITKIINRSGSIRDYYCKQCNSSSPTLKMVLKDHPNFDVNNLKIFNKNVMASAQDIPTTKKYVHTPNENPSKTAQKETAQCLI